MAKERNFVSPSWLLGKKIVGVELNRYDNRNHTGLTEQEIIAITLDDGSRLAFVALESESEPFVAPLYKPRKKEKTKW